MQFSWKAGNSERSRNLSSQWKKDVVKIIESRLKSMGFRKKKYLFLREVRPGLSASVGLNLGASIEPGALWVNPAVGLIHHQIEEMVRALAGDEYAGVTLVKHLGVISGHTSTDISYKFYEEPRGWETVMHRFTSDIERHATPFWQSDWNWVRLAEELGADEKTRRSFRLPVVLHLGGRPKEASDYMEDRLKELGDMGSGGAMMASQYAQFMDRLRQSFPNA